MNRHSSAALLLLLLPPLASSCADQPAREERAPAATRTPSDMEAPRSPEAGGEAAPADPAGGESRELATLGAGCFWCIEAVLEQIDGVVEVESGYMGGEVANPTYKEVCGGDTGHAEVVQVTFDPEVLSYEHLLEWFWKLHDPTTLNRQGNDVGTQYRSAIFYHSDEQRRVAEESKKRKDASGEFADPIVTEVTPASEFYVAEGYHQDYYRQNSQADYCRFVIAPKLDKLGLEK